jgi:hypothetical protein
MSNISCCCCTLFQASTTSASQPSSVVSHEGLRLAVTAADSYDTSYKVGVPKFRWISPRGQSVLAGVAVDCNGAEHLVVHTDQVSLL